MLYTVAAAAAAVAVFAASNLDLAIHINPPFASCLVAKVDSFAGTIEFDLSVSSQVDIQRFSDRQSAEALNCSIALYIDHVLLNYVRQGRSSYFLVAQKVFTLHARFIL